MKTKNRLDPVTDSPCMIIPNLVWSCLMLFDLFDALYVVCVSQCLPDRGPQKKTQPC